MEVTKNKEIENDDEKRQKWKIIKGNQGKVFCYLNKTFLQKQHLDDCQREGQSH